MVSEEQKKSSLFKSLLIYLFLVFASYMIADLVLLKYVRPQFLPKLESKDLTDLNIAREDFTGRLSNSEIGSKSFFVDPIVKRNIFNSGDMPLPIASLDKNSGSEEFEDNIPVKTNLGLTLEGTAVHRNPFRSIATIRGQKETATYTVGDQIENLAKVVSVLRKKVIFRNLENKKLEFVDIGREISRAQMPRPKAVSQRPKFSAPDGPLEREGNTFTTTRSEVNKYLSNYRSLLSQANTKPVRDPATGDTLGFEIFAIRPGSIFEQAGLKDGDIIDSVNGESITDQGKAMSLFNQLRTADEINISINRNGRSEELEYIIED